MDSVTGLGKFPEEGHGNPLQYSCLENSLDRGSWKPIVHGIAKFDTTEHTQAQYQIKLESQTIAWFYWALKLELQDNSI